MSAVIEKFKKNKNILNKKSFQGDNMQLVKEAAFEMGFEVG